MKSPHVYVIAEAGVNHDGDITKAHMLIDIAAQAGADAVKFQLFSPEALVTNDAPTATYQAQNLHDDRISQQAMLRKLVLPSDHAMSELEAHCRERKIDFLCTPFDLGSLQALMRDTSLRYLKLASGEVTNGPLLLAAARTRLPIILSTGMSNLDEIGEALGIVHFGYTHPAGYPRALSKPAPADMKALREKVTLLHCVSQYPAEPKDSHLRALRTMRDTFNLPVGFSDHSKGIDVALTAVAHGAVMIEKHFTYDTNAAGPDHKASLMPDELATMIVRIRNIENSYIFHCPQEELLLGSPEKRCQPAEENTRLVARRSVVASTDIKKGTVFTEDNLICKRPSTGEVSPNRLWELLGKHAKRDYRADEFIENIII